MKRTAIILGASALSISLVVAAFAHSGATGIVKERMDGMMAIGKSLGAVADMFKGKAPFDAAKVTESAGVLQEHAAKIPALFPDTEASRNGKGTEALPAVWEYNDDFVALAKLLETRSAELADISKSGDQAAVKVGFIKLAQTCSACHKDFRKRED